MKFPVSLRARRRQARNRRNASVARSSQRLSTSTLEALEPRTTPAAGFLQGMVFLDQNENGALDIGEPPIQGAEVRLYSGGGALLDTDFTDAQGQFEFLDLTAGDYTLVQVPPANMEPTGAQLCTQIFPASIVSDSEIDVTIIDPAQLTVVFDATEFFNRNLYEVIEFTANGTQIEFAAGELPVKVLGPNGFDSGEFFSFCLNVFEQFSGNGVDQYPVLGSPISTIMNGEKIAFLFNHFGGTGNLSSIEAAGLQVAIWELVYDAVPDLTAGNFKDVIAVPGFTTPQEAQAIVDAANNYLTLSDGQSELAMYLDASLGGVLPPTSPEDNGRQSIIAKCSFNFGLTPNGRVRGDKFEDLDADGVWDANEPGVQNFEIRAYADDGDGVLEQNEYDAGPFDSGLTGPGGGYELSLAPGDYIVVEVLQPGWTQSAPGGAPVLAPGLQTPGETLGQRGYVIEVSANEIIENQDFGNFRLGHLRARKFHDINANGVKEANEPFLSGFEIRAYADDGDGLLEQAEYNAGPAASGVTDGSGSVSMSVAPGDYVIVEVLPPPNWAQSAPLNSPVLAPGLNTGAEVLGPNGYSIEVVSGGSITNLLFGNFEDEDGRIRGIKFWDRNGNGIRNANGKDGIPGNADDEIGLQGWTILAYRDANLNGLLDQAEFDNGPEASDVTDANGAFEMEVPLGQYIVVEQMQDGWLQTAPPGASVLAPGLNTGAITLSDKGYVVVVNAGVDVEGRDFGNQVIGKHLLLSSRTAPMHDTVDLRDGAFWIDVPEGDAVHLTVKATYNQSQGSVYIDLLDEDLRFLDGVVGANGMARIDWLTPANTRRYLRIYGDNPQVEVHVGTQVHVANNVLTVSGGAAADQITFRAGTTNHRVIFNGLEYVYAASSVRNIVIEGGGGADQVRLVGTSQAETVRMNPKRATMTGQGFEVRVVGAPWIQVTGYGGDDVVHMNDSTGNDRLSMFPNAAYLNGSNFTSRAIGFAKVKAYAINGGYDRARMFGSSGDDQLTALVDRAALSGAGYLQESYGFERVETYGGGGLDRARFFDSVGDDRFHVRPEYVCMQGGGFSHFAMDFRDVQMQAGAGGDDRAFLYDSTANDRLVAGTNAATFYSQGMTRKLTGLDRLRAIGTAGGVNRLYYVNDQGAAINQAQFAAAADYFFATDGAWQVM